MLYIYYLAVMNVARAKEDGLIKPGTRQSLMLTFIVLPGVIMDWLTNMVPASILFLELPGAPHELVTGRLQRHCGKDTWRGKLATFICHHMLDHFDPRGRHCRGCAE